MSAPDYSRDGYFRRSLHRSIKTGARLGKRGLPAV
jgi:hypothetical protein